MTWRFTIPALAASLLTALLAGCSVLDRQRDSGSQDVASQRAERKETAVAQFERERDDAMYQAALARWRAGDEAACQALLTSLLRRNAQHRPARLLLADLLVAINKPKAAEQQLQILLERNPDDAQAHHALGMLLEDIGRTDEAVPHLDKATELVPDNQTYALSCEAVRSVSLHATRRPLKTETSPASPR